MALVHDLAECLVGDITPYCGVSKEEKHRRETVSGHGVPVEYLVRYLDPSWTHVYWIHHNHTPRVSASLE